MRFKIEQLRKNRGVTQEELERRSGVSRTIISSLEKGRRGCTTTKTLEQIAAVLKVSVRDLIEDE